MLLQKNFQPPRTPRTQRGSESRVLGRGANALRMPSPCHSLVFFVSLVVNRLPGLLGVFLGAAFLFTGTSRADGETAKSKLSIVPNVADASYGPHERNKLDLWQAKGDGPRPLVIFIHGGGWHGGDKGAVPEKTLKFLLDQGISVASLNYRFTPEFPLPAPVHDAARAVQFLRTKAGEWNLDPNRFGAMGVSAGGCTTLWLACHDDMADPGNSDPVLRASSRLQAAVGVSPQTSLEPEVVTAWIGPHVVAHPMILRASGLKSRAALNSPPPDVSALLKEFSPISHVSADDPPVLLVYPTVGELPAANPGAAIHHAAFGQKFQEKAGAAGSVCLLRIEDRPSQTAPKPEEFFLKQFTP